MKSRNDLVRCKALFFRACLGAVIGALWVVYATVFPAFTNAADPNLQVSIGAVAASTAATYQPTTRGPVSFNGSGVCPRFSGVINDTNLAAAPISSNISASSLDADDTVTLAVTLRNTSIDGAAYDILVRQSLPSGFELPGTGGEGANLCVYNGAGTSINYTSFGDGFFGPTDSDGIELTDPVGGALSPINASSGTNIAIITFDLRLSADYNPNSTKNLTTELLGYAAADNDDLITGSTDTASVKTGSFGTAMSLEATNQSFTPGNFVAVGEQLTYELIVAAPEGEIDNARIVDAMPEGVAFIDCLSIVNDTPARLTTNLPGGIGTACNDPTNPTVDTGTRTVTFSLGDLANTSRDNSNDETITLRYTGVITNEAAAFNTGSLSSAPAIVWDGGSTASESAPTTVHEPRLELEISTSPSGAVQPGEQVTVTLNLSHASASTTTAFEAALTHSVPAGLTLIPASLDCTNGSMQADSCSFSGNDVSAQWDSFAMGETGVITYQATVDAGTAGQSFVLTGDVDWSSLPGTINTPQSSYFAASVERTANNAPVGITAYSNNATINLAVASLTTTTSIGAALNQLLAATGQAWFRVSIIGIMLSVVGGVLLVVQRRRVIQ